MNQEATRPTKTARRLPPIPGNLRFFLLFSLLLATLFAILRLVLILRTRTPGLATHSELLDSFRVGLRFDIATACFISLPLIILCYLPWTAPWRGPRARRIYLWGLTALLAGITFTALAEVEFFREFQTRFNEIALRYLIHPQTVAGMIWYDYPVLQYAAAVLAAAAVLHLALRGIFRIAYPSGAQVASPLTRRMRIASEAGGAFGILLLIVFGARGGFRGEPLRWGDAFEGQNEYANQMSLNGLYSLANAARDMAQRGQVAVGWKGKIALPEARSVVRSLVVSPAEALLDPSGRTLLRHGDPGSPVRLTRADGKPLNVVVVMMESFSGRYSGSVGAARSFTPYFDELAKQGILFDRALSAGSHTHQGIFAIQLSFPNLPGYETLMESSAGNQNFSSLARIFESRGYETMFLYNGDLSWDNMSGFLQKQGFNTFISGAEMLAGAKYPDPVWGVSDTDLFERANREFEAASKKGPFQASIMTLSNHSPYIVPPVPGAEPITGFPGRQNERLQAFRYADYALGQFIEEAKKLSYFKDTLFVFIGDHGTNVSPQLTEVHLLFHHVPLLFYAPGLMADRGIEPRVDHRTASQLDIIPSILALLNITDAPHSSWGRSLFDDSFKDGGFAVFKQSGGGRAVALAQGSYLLVLNSAAGRPLLMNYDLGPVPTLTPLVDPTLQTRMERELRAYLQCALHDLSSRAVGSDMPPRK